jgi:hypothetical protein
MAVTWFRADEADTRHGVELEYSMAEKNQSGPSEAVEIIWEVHATMFPV